MENTNHASQSQEPNERLSAIEARLSLIERKIAEQSERLEVTENSVRTLEQATPSDELERHREQLRDYERALVERIADVDDDRRATASRLQRAWQTQREELDERLRRHAGLLGGLLLVFAVLFAVALFLVNRQASMGLADLAHDAATIRQELAQLSGERALDEQVREKLDGLTAQVGEISALLEGATKDGQQALEVSLATERADRVKAQDRLAAQIQRLDTERSSIAQALDSLRSTLRTLESRLADGGTGMATGMSAATRAVAAPVPVPDEAAGVPDGSSTPDVTEEELPVVKAKVDRPAETGGPDGPAPEASAIAASDEEETLVAGGDIYVLQLIGFHNRKSLNEFVARTELPERVYAIQQTYRGRPWYVVIHSLHDDYAAAEEELSRLPEDLVALNPWIRRLGDATELEIIETGQESESALEPGQ
jgi:DamX protein